MTDIEEALRLTKRQKFYAQNALELAAQNYDAQGEPQHASNCRMLATRIGAHETTRRQPAQEEASAWQQKIMQTQGNPEKVYMVMREWWSELVNESVDPAAALVEAILPMMAQAGQQTHHAVHLTVLEILVTVDVKIRSIINDPRIPDNLEGMNQVFREIIGFVDRGRAQAERGEPLWSDDQHLQENAEALGEELKKAAAAYRAAQEQGQQQRGDDALDDADMNAEGMGEGESEDG